MLKSEMCRPGVSEPKPDAKPNKTLVDAFTSAVGRAADDAEIAVGDVVFRIAEMRRVRQVENLGSELKRAIPAERELAEHAQVKVGKARTPQAVEAGGAESALGNRPERRRVEPRTSRLEPEDLDLILDLVGDLLAAGQVQRRARRLYRERPARIRAEQPVHLPAAEDDRQGAAVIEEAPVFTEGQLRDERRLEVMRSIVRKQRLIQMEKIQRLYFRRIVAQRIAADPESPRPRICHVRLKTLSHATRQ